MLFQIYGDGAGWQLLGWVLVFAGLVLANFTSTVYNYIKMHY